VSTPAAGPSPYHSLVTGLLSATRVGPATYPTLPSGRRANIIRVLSQLLIRTDLLKTYLRVLAAERGSWMGLDRPTAAGFPLEDVVRDGLDCLTDDDLAQFAVDAVGLATFHDYLMEHYEDGECGQVWYDAMLRDTEHPVPYDSAPPSLINNLLRRFREAAFPGVDGATVADEIGIDRLAEYESGATPTPPASEVARVLKGYGCENDLLRAVTRFIELGAGLPDGTEARDALEDLVKAVSDDAKRRKLEVVSVRGAIFLSPFDPNDVSYYVLPPAVAAALMADPGTFKQVAARLSRLRKVVVVGADAYAEVASAWPPLDVTCCGRLLVYWHVGARVLRASADERDIGDVLAGAARFDAAAAGSTTATILEALQTQAGEAVRWLSLAANKQKPGGIIVPNTNASGKKE
jgi:hypothetical protein